MSDLPENLDLKFLPDWLKESESQVNRYANYEGESGDRPRRDDRRGFGAPRSDRGPDRRGPRPPGGRDSRGPRRDDRGPRGPRPGGDRPRGERPGKGGRRDDRGGAGREVRGPAPEPIKPLAVKVEFIPEPGMLAAIAKEMRSSHRAYPIFSAAKMILTKTPLHRVRITTADPGLTLHQLGDGTITSDRSLLERDAFRQLKDKYYREEVEQVEAPKGIFSNVARLRASGLVLAPTNHHSYQPMLRRVFEERYSRRMSFLEFQQREIEVVTDEQAINDWKEKARSVVTFVTTQEPEPQKFKTQAEVEAHFRQNYLPQEIKSGTSFEANGTALRGGPDRSLGAAIGAAFDREFAFPFNVVNAMRPALTEAGLTFFKHRKRVVYASSVRPLRHPAGQPARENVLAILRTIEANPRCSRRDLALKILGEHFDAPEKMQEKTELAADLHYLLLAGHVIEFVDGRFDLPLPPKAQAEEAREGAAGQAASGDAGDEELDAADSAPSEAPDAATSEAAPAPEAPAPAPAESPVEAAAPSVSDAPGVPAEPAPSDA